MAMSGIGGGGSSGSNRRSDLSDSEISQQLMRITLQKQKMTDPFASKREDVSGLFHRYVDRVESLECKDVVLAQEGLCLLGASKIFCARVDCVNDVVKLLATQCVNRSKESPEAEQIADASVDRNGVLIKRKKFNQENAQILKEAEYHDLSKSQPERSDNVNKNETGRSILWDFQGPEKVQEQSQTFTTLDSSIRSGPSFVAIQEDTRLEKTVSTTEVITIDDNDAWFPPDASSDVEEEMPCFLLEISRQQLLNNTLENEKQSEITSEEQQQLNFQEVEDPVSYSEKSRISNSEITAAGADACAKSVKKTEKVKSYGPATRKSSRNIGKLREPLKRKTCAVTQPQSKRQKINSSILININTSGDDSPGLSDYISTVQVRVETEMPANIQFCSGHSGFETFVAGKTIKIEQCLSCNDNDHDHVSYNEVNEINNSIKIESPVDDLGYNYTDPIVYTAPNQTPSNILPEHEEIIQKYFNYMHLNILHLNTSKTEKTQIYKTSLQGLIPLFSKYDLKLQEGVISAATCSQELERMPCSEVRKNMLTKYRESCHKVSHPKPDEITKKSRTEFEFMVSEIRGKIVTIFSRFPLEMEHNQEFLEQYCATKRKMDEAIRVQTNKEEFDVQKYARKIIDFVNTGCQTTFSSQFVCESQRFSEFTPSRDSGVFSACPSQLQWTNSPISRASSEFMDNYENSSQELESEEICDSGFVTNCLTPIHRHSDFQEDEEEDKIPMAQIFNSINVSPDEGEIARNFSAILQALSTKKLKAKYVETSLPNLDFEFASSISPLDKNDIKHTYNLQQQRLTDIENISIAHGKGSDLSFLDLEEEAGDIPDGIEKDIHQKLSEFVEEDGDVYAGVVGGERKKAGTVQVRGRGRQRILGGRRKLYFDYVNED